MATQLGQELSSLTLSQKANGTGGTIDPKALLNTAKYLDEYERELKRIFGESVKVISEINKQSGQMFRRFFVPKEYEQQLQGAVKSITSQIEDKGAQPAFYVAQSFAPAHMVETTREIKGSKAQQYAREELLSVGGTIKHTAGTSNKDMMTSYVPVLDDDWNSMSKTERAKALRDLTPQANKASVAEQKSRTAKERADEIEANFKRKKIVDKENRIKTQNERKEIEKREKERDQEQKKELKEKKASRQRSLSIIGRIFTAIVVLADITRRILTSVMNYGSQLSKEASQARTLEITTQQIKQLQYLDTALGLEKGTNLQAQEDLRASFGNTAKLDTEKLKWLAMVMGDKVSKEVLSGLGGDNPAKLNEEILDEFFKRWQSGKDQYGNDVGQEKARRALVTLLESVSPSIARQLERMIEEQTNGLNAGNVISWSQLMSLYRTGSGGLTDNDYAYGSLIGKEVDELKANFNALSDAIKTDLLIAISGLVGWLNKTVKKWNMSETEEYEASLEGRNFLLYKKAQYEQAQAVRKQHLEEAFGMPVETAVDTMENLRGTSEAEWSASDKQLYQNMKNVYNNPVLYNELGMYFATKKKLSDIKERFNKGNFVIGNKADYSDEALIKLSEDTSVLETLGFSSTGVFTGSQYDFGDGSSIAKDYWDRLATWKDVSPDVREDFAYKALNYLQTMESTPADYRNKDNAEWAGYQRASAEILHKYGKPKAHISELLTKYTNRDLTEADFNSSEFNMLMDIVTALYSPASTNKSNAGGLGVTAKQRQSAMNAILYSAGKYGLDVNEWASIMQAQKQVELDVAKQGYASKVSKYNYSFSQGEGGRINIEVKMMDSTGKVLDTISTSAVGNIDRDFNTSYVVDGGHAVQNY